MFGRSSLSRLVCSVTVALGSFSAAGPVSAGTNRWTSHGPLGGFVSALVIDPSSPATLYAGTSNDGLFTRKDGGGRWAPANDGLQYSEIRALVIDPAMPTTLYVASARGAGVFKSTDGGRSWGPAGGGSWGPVNDALSDSDILALAIDPSSPTTLYAAGFCYGSRDRGCVVKSTDGGRTWAFYVLPSVYYVAVVAIDRSSPATLYAGMDGDGVFKSVDGGGSWRPVNNGLPSHFEVSTLVIDPATPATLYVATDYGPGVFKSTDGGRSWGPANNGLPDYPIYDLAIDPTAPATLYAGTFGRVFKSTDGGASWSPLNSALSQLEVAVLAI